MNTEKPASPTTTAKGVTEATLADAKKMARHLHGRSATDPASNLRTYTVRMAEDDAKAARLINALLAALSLPASPTQGELAVRALEWRENPLGNFVAESIVGQYFVFKEDNVWNWVVVDISAWRNFPSPEAAKAAAQADFEARILSALDRTTLPATGEEKGRIFEVRDVIPAPQGKRS